MCLTNGCFMLDKKVKDIMIPVEMYPTVKYDVTMFDAMMTLMKARENAPPGIPPYRAVLVFDDNNKVIGKIGHFAFLKAFEPRYQNLLDVDKLSKVNLSPELIETIFEKFSLWQELPFEPCDYAKRIKAIEIMQPITERVEEDETIARAIHKIIMWQCLSLLVTRNNEVVGILRASDLYNEIENYVTKECKKMSIKGNK